ncbi:metalloprotease TldD [Buchnera aphidicola]|uniref:metalloprotease TldD n=1 Tax=Buchnera aphidicola TaxID=9 RepID=UPI0034647606
MSFNLVSDYFLEINKIQYQDLFSILYDCMKYKIDYAEIYFQSIISESWILDDKIIKEGIHSIDSGFGARVIHQESTGFSYSDQITLHSIQNSFSMACSFMRKKKQYKKHASCLLNNLNKNNNNYLNSIVLQQLTVSEKISILYHVDKIARHTDHRVIKVNAILSGYDEKILVSATDETFASDIRPLVYLSISVVVESQGVIEKGYSGGGGRLGYDFFFEKNELGEMRLDTWTKQAVRIAVSNLFAKDAPSGTFPVVLGCGWPGILLHEAVGHGLEGDFNLKKSSIFYKKINQKITSSLCTIVDDGTMLNTRGSIYIDDEGTPGKYNILIKNGILKKYMQDKLTARLMHQKPTGNGRRESYAHLPKPRMTNTYMLPGNSSVSDIISSIDYGIFAVNFSGGQVDITSGKFVFSTSEAFLIKNGRIAFPIKGVTLIGSGIEVMNQISMVGNDFKMDDGTGICIKDGQQISVGVGQPTIKLDKLTIGGIK